MSKDTKIDSTFPNNFFPKYRVKCHHICRLEKNHAQLFANHFFQNMVHNVEYPHSNGGYLNSKCKTVLICLIDYAKHKRFSKISSQQRGIISQLF